MYFHWSYIILLPGMLLTFFAQSRIRGQYARYSKVQSSLGMTGAQVAQTILSKMGVNHVKVEAVRGQLTDHYDPTAKAVRLSEGIYSSSSLAAAAVAAHECGHVLQDVQGYQFMNLRASLVPVANLGSQLGPMLIMAGIFMGQIPILLNLGILFFAGSIAFHIVTLPVEFDASRRALKLIDEFGILQGEENRGARAVLGAAALTYVATAIYSLLQLAQYLLIASSRRR